jgi:transketolase
LRNTFVKTLYEEAKINENIVLITGDLGFQLFDDFQKNLPKQFINAGLTEQSMMSMAAGIASTGKRVFVYSIANFSTLRCLEQIRNDVCYMNNSVVVVSVGAGFAYGTLGYSHHATEDIAIMRSLPNMQVISPCDQLETEVVTKILTSTNNPSYLRLGKTGEINLNVNIPKMSQGKFNVLSQGQHGYIFFTGSVGVIAQKAAKQLGEIGINVSLISVPFISELDKNYLTRIIKNVPIVIVEEHASRGGLGAAFMEAFVSLDEQIKLNHVSAGLENLTLTGDQEFLREANGISLTKIVEIFTKT